MNDPYIQPEALFKFAGEPDAIPAEQKNRFWGFLNKQLAFANWDKEDLLIMEEELAQLKIREMAAYTEDQLVDMDDSSAYSQVGLIAKGLMTLGKNGFLVRQSRTTSSSYEMKGNNEQKSKLRNLFTPKNGEKGTQ